mgnify:CR=1 FL=1
MVYFCYIDESGTPQIPGNSSHYVLCGISIPINKWKQCDRQIAKIKKKYNIQDAEIHTAWILRPYLEQSLIPDFDRLSSIERKVEVNKLRKKELYRLQKSGNKTLHKQTRKNYRKTDCYTHLSHPERVAFIQEIADLIGKWSFMRIFAEAIDKSFFDPSLAKDTVDERSLEQVVSRFERYMANVASSKPEESIFGAIIHDNNETVAKRHTELMKQFHRKGTLWTKIEHIIETPLFVNSELTCLVQIADLCSYVLKRFFENGETDLLNRIKNRFDKYQGRIVGVRHYSDESCPCFICQSKHAKGATTKETAAESCD